MSNITLEFVEDIQLTLPIVRAIRGDTGPIGLIGPIGPIDTSAIEAHENATNPHPQYALISALGTAAATDSSDYATAAQGEKADTALQSSDIGTTTGTVAAGDDARLLAVADKVDKVTGKGLSTEDYSTAEKSKLAGIATGANNYTHPANHPPSIITQDASNRFVTDAEKSTWNAKEPAITAGTAAQYLRGDKSWQPAADLPVSTAQAAAIVAATAIYTTEALGRAAVADGQAFKVQGSGDVAAYEFRRIDASTSVPITSYPAVSAVSNISSAVGNQASAADSVTGSTNPNTSNASGAAWSSGKVIAQHSVISSIAVRTSALMIADVFLVDAGSRVVLAKASSVTFDSGVSSVTRPFGLLASPAGAIVFISRVSGGYLRVATDSGPCINVAASAYSVGDTFPAFTSLAGYALAISITSSVVSNSLGSRLQPISAGRLDESISATRGSKTRQRAASFTPTALGPGSGGNMAKRFLGDGVLTAVSITVTAVSSGILEHWRVINGLPTLLERCSAELAVGATSVQVPRWIMRGESYICYAPIRGAQACYGVGGSFYYFAAAARSIGATASVSIALGYAVGIGLTVEAPAGVSAKGLISGRATLNREDFSSTPSDWTIAAPFSVANGLLSSGTGAWDKFAGYSKVSAIHKRKLSARIIINDAASVFGLATQTVGGPVIGGAVAMIDGAAGKLRIYSWPGTATAGTLTSEVALSALTVGRAYLLVVTIDNFAVSVTLTDTVTRAVTTVSGSFGLVGGTSRFHGRPGFIHLAGDVKVEWAHAQVDAPLAQRAVIFGDSNTDGAAVTNPSWAHQLVTSYGGILVSARSGEASTDMARRLDDLAILRPQMAICAHGTNDTSLQVWRGNVGDFVDTCRDINAEPILVRPLPKTAATAFITSIDADITANYFGKLRSIDFLGAMSNANDRVTWNAAYDNGDHLHANNAGQVIMAAQALVDVPELAV